MAQGHKQRIAGGMAAHLYAQAVTILTQLASLPIFLQKWSSATYGEWLMLSAVPVYLTMADAGILTAGGNLMSMAMAREDFAEMNRLFRCSLLIVAIFVPVLGLIIVGLLGVFSFSLTQEQRITLGALMLAALLTVACGLFDAAYRPFGKYPRVTVYLTTTRIIEWIGTLAGVYLVGTLSAAAVGFFAGRAVSCLVLLALARRDLPGLEWSFRQTDSRLVRRLFMDGVGFLSFPAGQLINLQGLVLVVGTALGTSAVAQFNTLRTLTRVLAQVSNLTGKALAPEVSALHGAGNDREAARLSFQVLMIVLPLTIVGALCLSAAGPTIIAMWGKGKIAFDRLAFSWLLAAAIASTYWQIQSIRFTATNRHTSIAKLYIFASIAGLIFAASTMSYFGMVAAPAASFGVDLAMSVATFVEIRRVRLASPA